MNQGRIYDNLQARRLETILQKRREWLLQFGDSICDVSYVDTGLLNITMEI